MVKKSVEELIHLALTEKDDPIVNKCIYTLQKIGSYEILKKAKQLCESNKIPEKYLGIDILGQLGIPKRTFPNQCLNILLNLLQTETNSEIICSIGISLGHLRDRRVIQPLVKFKNHSHPDVRYSVVIGLLTHEDEDAINTLIELSSDIDSDVRNWATFGLGSLIEVTNNKIEEALWKRIIKEKQDTDTSYEIYSEALLGLARRKDTRIVNILLKELQSDSVGILMVEAAEELCDRKLYSALIELRQWWDCSEDLLERAIKNCHPVI